MALQIFRDKIAQHTILTPLEFSKTDLSDLTQRHRTPSVHRNTLIYYLHYLCMIGRIQPLRSFLQGCVETCGDIDWLINDHGQYDFWFSTPLHTVTDWNNDPQLAQLLIEYGADPNITNYYDSRPGRDEMGSLMIIPFTLEFDLLRIPTDQHSYYCRHEDEFQDIIQYLDSIQNQNPDQNSDPVLPAPSLTILDDQV